MKDSARNTAYQPVVIIGAARSGTNMLRDVLTHLQGFGTWPCDEINYIWRHGNMREATDEFSPDLATEPVQVYIRRAFWKLAQKRSLSHVVEKTCANALRVGFVHRVLPNSQFIHIIRDGRDVVNSARKRWTAPLDIPYMLRKARFVPVADIPYYSSCYLLNRLYRLWSRHKRLAFWGPHFKGMAAMLQHRSLEEVCAVQWQRCVNQAEHDLGLIDSTHVCWVRYEDFVAHPEIELQRLAAFLKVKIPKQKMRQLLPLVSSQSVGKWEKELDLPTVEAMMPLMRDTLKRWGYNVFPGSVRDS